MTNSNLSTIILLEVIALNIDLPIYITDITVFESYNQKYKPTFVNGRTFHSLTYRHSGKISIKYDDTELISFPDSITFIPKGASYTTEIFEDVHITAVHFNFIGKTFFDKPKVIDVKNSKILSLFSALSKTVKDSSSHFTQLSIFYKLLDELNKYNCTSTARPIPSKIENAKLIIENKYSNSFFSIESLAEEIQISTTYLRREFHRIYGISPIAYLKDTRIKHATTLLLTHNLTVTKIAEMCGYSSTSYFIQDFHKVVGESPTEYRAKFSTTP